MGDYVEEFVAFLGWEVDDKELKEFKNQVNKIGQTIKRVSLVVAAFAGTFSVLTLMTNRATGATTALARAVGVSSEFLEAMGQIVKPLGFDFENVADLIEEMNNKIGESTGLGEPMIAVAESVKILGLDFKKLKDLAPEDQFVRIMEAAENLEDQQQAVSAVDMLMGGEANRVLGFLRSQDEGMLALIKRRMQLNMLNDRGRAGAERFNKTVGEISGVLDSVKAQFFGLIGEGLAPMLEMYTDWVAANNEIIKAKIEEWATAVGRALRWLISQFKWFISMAMEVIDALGGVQNAFKLASLAIGAMLGARTILAFIKFIKFMKATGSAALLMNAKIALIPVLIAGIIAFFALLGEDLYMFFTGGESALGKLGETIANFVHNNVTPTIANFLGMTVEEFDAAFLAVTETIFKFFAVDIPNAHDAATSAIADFAWMITEFLITDLPYALERSYDAFIQFFINLGKGLVSAGHSIINFFTGLAKGFVTFVSSIPDKLLTIIRETVSSITAELADIPLIGDLVHTPAAGGANPQPSSGARLASSVAKTTNSSSTTSNTSAPNITINQQPGQSGQSLAKDVTIEIEKAFARAVKVNSSGIEN